MFVFSYWYIVLAVLAVGIGLAVFFLVRMDRKDRKMLAEFVDSAKQEETNAETSKVEEEKETKTE